MTKPLAVLADGPRAADAGARRPVAPGTPPRAQEIYFGKTKDIVNDLRSIRSLSESKAATDMTNELVAKLKGKAK